jgi:phosphoglycerol transferase MdoB-like AlkP superfamily enzyme
LPPTYATIPRVMLSLGLGTEYFLFGGAGVISLLAFTALILVPAIGAYGRTWEKATAALLSVFVLIVLVLIGVAIGVLIVYYWPQITEAIPGL